MYIKKLIKINDKEVNMTIDALLVIIGEAIIKTALVGLSLAITRITFNVIGKMLKNAFSTKENN